MDMEKSTSADLPRGDADLCLHRGRCAGDEAGLQAASQTQPQPETKPNPTKPNNKDMNKNKKKKKKNKGKKKKEKVEETHAS